MPSTSDELRALMAKWFPEEGNIPEDYRVMDFLLSHGYTEMNGFISPPVPAHTPSDYEHYCIRYLVEEWDYAFTGRKGFTLIEADTPMLCHCNLSGDIHLISDGRFCEICEPRLRLPADVEQVRAALKFLADRAIPANFEADAYTTHEGGPWLPWQKDCIDAGDIHSVRFKNGRIWDSKEGWR